MVMVAVVFRTAGRHAANSTKAECNWSPNSAKTRHGGLCVILEELPTSILSGSLVQLHQPPEPFQIAHFQRETFGFLAAKATPSSALGCPGFC
jgi:hypothetical protein